MPKFVCSSAAPAAALLVASMAAGAQSAADAAATPVVVIVRIPKPWYAPRAVVVSKMRDSVAQYAKLPGLAFKAFSFERDSGDFGGVYFWRDRASATAWFDGAWFERVRKERGSEGQVRTFDAPVSVDNTAGGTAAQDDSKSMVTLVEIPVPPGLTRERLTAGLRAAVPEYQKVPGLLRKHFILSEVGAAAPTFGGVYLWRDEAAARAWFNEAWQARVRSTYGQPPRIEWFDTPILLPTQDSANSVPPSAMIVATP